MEDKNKLGRHRPMCMCDKLKERQVARSLKDVSVGSREGLDVAELRRMSGDMVHSRVSVARAPNGRYAEELPNALRGDSLKNGRSGSRGESRGRFMGIQS